MTLDIMKKGPHISRVKKGVNWGELECSTGSRRARTKKWSALDRCKMEYAPGQQHVSCPCSLTQLFTKQQILRLVQIQSICRRQNKYKLKAEFHCEIGRKHCGKRRKCLLPAFSHFPSIFSGSFNAWIVW